ncbi:hypothetical protein KL866_09360 [Alteromonas sp. ALT199]|nr:hypothetical protein [Alteromonas sp. ALT199]MBT3135307.1 hypothetical protein [Alteromonas sp. ALT199]
MNENAPVAHHGNSKANKQDKKAEVMQCDMKFAKGKQQQDANNENR